MVITRLMRWMWRPGRLQCADGVGGGARTWLEVLGREQRHWRGMHSGASSSVELRTRKLPENFQIDDEIVFEDQTNDKQVDFAYYDRLMKEKQGRLENFAVRRFADPLAEDGMVVQLDPTVFGAPVRIDILHRYVRWVRAMLRQGTHKVKTISERRGTGKKPFRQKGTGKARQGSLRAPHMKKGGRVHGPVVRSHEHKLPKKVRKFAFRSALSAKFLEDNLTIVDRFSSEDFPEVETGVRMKTRHVHQFLDHLGLTSSKVLYVDSKLNNHLALASRNLSNQNIVTGESYLKLMDILRADHLILSIDAARALENRLHFVKRFPSESQRLK